MSFRRLPDLSTRDSTPITPIEQEVLGEMASALGAAGRLVEQRLAALRACDPADDDRPRIRRAAAEAVHIYFIQREACGLRRHETVIAEVGIPGEVLAILGAKERLSA